MTLMNDFQGGNGETDIENRPMDKVGGEEGEGEMYGESNIEIYNTMCKTDKSMGICCMTQGTQTGPL